MIEGTDFTRSGEMAEKVKKDMTFGELIKRFPKAGPIRLQTAAFYLVRGGFEPPKATPTDLQSAPFGHSGTSPGF
jgi:hypothetical protein